mgnify:CR=1 FL=1
MCRGIKYTNSFTVLRYTERSAYLIISITVFVVPVNYTFKVSASVYIGNGMVAHNIGEIKIQSLESWIKTYKGFAWGNEGGVY